MNTEVEISMSCHHTCKFNIFDRFLCSLKEQYIVPFLSSAHLSVLTRIPKIPSMGRMGSWQCFRGLYRLPLMPNGSNCFSRGVCTRITEETCDFPTWDPVQIFIGVTALLYGPRRKKTCLPGLQTTKVHVANIIMKIYTDG